MKKLKIIYLLLACMLILLSCKKDETRAIISDSPKAPVLIIPDDGTSIVITKDNGDTNLNFQWSRGDFGFQASLTNIVQITSKTSNFKKSKLFLSKPPNADSSTIAYKDLNAALLAVPISLTANKMDTVFVRVETILFMVDTVFSPTIKLIVTPYK